MRLPFLLKNRNFYFMLTMDALLVILALFLAFSLRFDGIIPEKYLDFLFEALPFAVPLKLAVFYACGLYYGMWRYTGLRDLRNVLLASVLSSLLFLPMVFMLQMSPGIPRSVLILDMGLTFLFIAGIRIAVRIGMVWRKSQGNGSLLDSVAHKRMAIIGAGHSGETLVREMNSNPGLKMRPAVLFDDDPVKHGKTVHGCPIAGGIDEIIKKTRLYDEILIALPSVKGDRMRHIARLCEQTGKPFRIMPKMGEIMDGQLSVKVTRRLRFEDLLGREEIGLERGLIEKTYTGKKILVTGAGGSIGSELVRQVAQFNPRDLILADFSEYNLFRIDLQVRRLFPDISVRSRLVDIRERQGLDRLMKDAAPEMVLHAAAYKHVPLQELNPWEAVQNNIFGTRNMILASIENQVESFVLVSTDKAVRPTSVMGATKRVAEILTECANVESGCCFSSVRFGNVLGSSGSVIPVFEEQIARGMPVTVTHPEVTRYFMSVSEAAQLILQAGAMARGGEIFILDMGEPVRIQDLARDLIRLHGLEPDKDIPISFIGLRPGEKLYEELITEGEGILSTRHEKIMVLRGRSNNSELLYKALADLNRCALDYDSGGIKAILKNLVPEYLPK